MKKFEIELQYSADRLVKEIMSVKIGETVVITADTNSDERVVNATAASVFAIGGKPMVIWMATPAGVGKAADNGLPVEALGAVLEKTDVWIEFNHQWLLYSTPFEIAYENNPKLRYICLVEMTPEMMIRNIGKFDIPKMSEFLKRFTELNKLAERMRITTPAGTELSFETNPKHLVSCDAGDASQPGIFMMPGQINVVPKFGSVNGQLVFDGSIVPPIGLLDQAVTLKIEKSKIVSISGGAQARKFEDWLASFDDPNMYQLAHIAYGLNPGSQLTGNIVEDERVWGVTEWGIGYVSPYDAPPDGQDAKSHCDGICLDSTVYLDDKMVMQEGRFVLEELMRLEEEILQGARL